MTCEYFRHILYHMDPRTAAQPMVSSMWKHAKQCPRCKRLVPKAFTEDTDNKPYEKEKVACDL